MPKSILVIDDEQLVIKSLVKYLGTQGYEVETASNGKEAIDKVKTSLFDLIIADIRMPEMDGIEAIKRIRAICEETHKLKIPEIIMTGYALDDTQKEASELGIKDYFYKPFEINDFINAVQRNLKDRHEKEKVQYEDKVETAVEALKKGWADDYEARCKPDMLTQLFHESVPILKFLDWRVTKTRRGFTETLLPLNTASTNQHITHQAAIMLIAADYTGGISLGTLLHDVPVIGIHSQKTDSGAYLWAGKADIRWARPSCEDLILTAQIPQERHETIVRRFFGGKRVLETVKIEMRNATNLVAETNMTYWVQDSRLLSRNAFDQSKVHVLYDYRIKTSAKLIAGLRAIEDDKDPEERLFSDPYAHSFADKHGRVLAERFCMIAPQIQSMVAARTKHLDDALKAFANGEERQVINIGVGRDARPWRLDLPNITYFELDLPLMLQARHELLKVNNLLSDTTVKPIAVPIDLNEHDIHMVLKENEAFIPDLPTFVCWEGGSMYFDDQTTSKIFSGIREIINNSKSRFWMDYVNEPVVKGETGIQVVEKFIQGMQRMGEPFINGYKDIERTFKSFRLVVESETSVGMYINSDDPVLDLYNFCIAKPI